MTADHQTQLSSAIKYSLGYGKSDNTPNQHTAATFADFVAAIDSHRATGKGQHWFAGPFCEAPDDESHRDGSKALAIGRPHRCRRCTQPRNWIGLDVDSPTADGCQLTAESFAALVQLLHRRSGAVYTTASHREGAPRCRVVLELDRPLPREELIRAAERVRAGIDAAMVGQGYSALPWDSSCDKPEQPLYAPVITSQFYRLEGQPIVVAELMADGPPAPDRTSLEPPRATPAAQADPYAIAAVDRALRAIAAAPEGARNDVINREAHGLGGFVGQGRLSRPLVENVLIEATRAAGWSEPGKTEATIRSGIVSGMQQPRTDGLPNQILMSLGSVKETAPDKLKLVDLSGLRTAVIEGPKFVIEPLIPCGVLTLFGGHGGSGKSMLALAWAALVACGQGWAGLQSSGTRRCLFVSLEDPGELVRYRLRGIAEVYGLDFEAIERNLRVVDGADMDAALVSEVSEFGTRKLRPTARLHEVAELARGAGFIVIDNASDSFDGDENNRQQVRYFVRLLSSIARANDAGLLLLAHIDKAAAIHGSRGNSYSGSTAWHNSARSRLALVPIDDVLHLLHEKANLSAVAAPIAVRIDSTTADARVLVPVQPDSEATREDAARRTKDDAAMILSMIANAVAAGIEVPVAMRGPSTAAHALALLAEFPREYKSREGRQRVAVAITHLLRMGHLERVAVRSSSRNTKELLKLTPAGEATLVPARALVPHTPSAIDARAEGRASVDVDQIESVTHETHETDAGCNFAFSPHGPGVLTATLEVPRHD